MEVQTTVIAAEWLGLVELCMYSDVKAKGLLMDWMRANEIKRGVNQILGLSN